MKFKGNGLALNGFTVPSDKFVRVPTVLFEATLKARLTGRQFRVLYWVIRNTYGYHRHAVKFTWYKIAKELRMSHGGVVTVGNQLVRLKILDVRENNIRVQKEYEEWPKSIIPSQKSTQPLLPGIDPPKDLQPLRGRIETTPSKDLNHSVEGSDFRRAKDNLKKEKDTTAGDPLRAPVVVSQTFNEKKDLTPIQQVVLGWKVLSKIPQDDKAWDKVHFARCAKSAKALLDLFGKVDDVLDCMDFLYHDFEEKKLTCTFETIVKHSDRFRERLARYSR